MTHRQAFTRDELKDAHTSLYTEERPVRFQDVDAAGTIFYPRMLEYFSDAFMGLLGAIGFRLAEQIAHGTWRSPIVHAEADYMAPLMFGDTAVVDVVGAKVGESSFTLGFRVRRRDGKIAALGQVVHVSIDRSTLKPVRVPDAFRAALLTPAALRPGAARG